MGSILSEWAIILAVFLAFTVVTPIIINYSRFSGLRRVRCPNLKRDGEIRLNTVGAAFSSTYGDPNLRITSCTLLGRAERCHGACLAGSPL